MVPEADRLARVDSLFLRPYGPCSKPRRIGQRVDFGTFLSFPAKLSHNHASPQGEHTYMAKAHLPLVSKTVRLYKQAMCGP